MKLFSFFDQTGNSKQLCSLRLFSAMFSDSRDNLDRKQDEFIKLTCVYLLCVCVCAYYKITLVHLSVSCFPHLKDFCNRLSAERNYYDT